MYYAAASYANSPTKPSAAYAAASQHGGVHYATPTKSSGSSYSPTVWSTAAAAAAPSTPPRQVAAAAAPSSFMTQVSRPGSAAASSSSHHRQHESSAAPSTPTRQVMRRDSVGTPPRSPALPPHQHHHRMLLVLDMDETLLHASVTPTADHHSRFRVEMGNNQSVDVYVKFRPYVKEFLAACARHFEVAVFTASISPYANQVLDHIDPQRKYVHHRLFREHCTEMDGTYVKDLSLLARPLHRVAIVDNSPVAYSLHPQNAIPITSWFDDDNDTELLDLIDSLEQLARQHSVYEHLEVNHPKGSSPSKNKINWR